MQVVTQGHQLLRSWKDAPEKQAITWLNYERNVFFYAIFNDSMWICPANERQCYNVTQSLIGWPHSQNDPCILGKLDQLIYL